jgi:S-methylmethionine-dependent homocysteine/selenocysteine methylase
MAEANRQSIALLLEMRGLFESEQATMVISGCVGPRGDGYRAGEMMTADEAQAYHARQIGIFAESEADMVTAITMTYAEEAVGIARAARAEGLPVVISFTVETDGRLPSGQSLKDAVEAVDAATGKGPAYFMINCAHPDHFEEALAAGEGWVRRIKGLRANASRLSHAELDEAVELDAGDPEELGQQYRELRRRLGHITVLGGCCGTDHRHIEAICQACTTAAAA